MQEKKTVMISSTARDLPAHRKEVMDACLRQGMHPVMMEHLSASGDEAIGASLKMVNEADVYLGVFAHRYGYVPDGHEISVTEMEYDRAVERGIPRLIFVMGEDHPIKAKDIEVEAAAQLKAFKARVQAENIVNFFDSPADLRAKAIDSLSRLREPNPNAFHYISDIPAPPEPFIAHPYTLLQTHRLVGRQAELNLLTDWVAKPGTVVYNTHILNIVALGGVGKSALTWKWFTDIAPQEMKPLAGRMWWSFYESDARFENFVERALAYVSRKPLAEVQQIPAPDREAQLLTALDREPFLLVLDGLERILTAYARMDAAHLSDDEYDQATANWVANAIGLPAGAAQSFTGQHRLRKTADPRAGAFLRKLTTVRYSRILVSTRLYPFDLQTITGEPLGNSFALFLPGLAEGDALDLWRSFGASGSRDELSAIFRRVENHPLLIQSLAGEVARYRRAPGDFDQWRKAHPDFDPFRELPLVQTKSHVLEFALRGVEEVARHTLQTMAAFRSPASYDALAAILIGDGKPCTNEQNLDAILAELEDRGLVGWDKRANRYDLHPIVRGVVWGGLESEARQGVYTRLHAHFEAAPMIEDYLEVNSLEDLTPAMELYHTLIGLGRYDDAYIVFRDRLEGATLYRLSASRQRIELLESLFPDGVEQAPRLSEPGDQSFTLNALAQGYQLSGQPGRAIPLFRRHNEIRSAQKDDQNLSVGLGNLSNALRLSGALREAESAARQALLLTRTTKYRFGEGLSLYLLGLLLPACGTAEESAAALRRSLRIWIAQSNRQFEGLVNAFLAQRALWVGDFADACKLADRAWELAHELKLERDFIRAARLQGAAALGLGLGDFPTAEERLHHALTRARQVNLAEEELHALIALAEMRRRQGRLPEARELLDDVWDGAERGPYPLEHADALNVLAQIERDAGRTAHAIDAATQAYRLAWCDGPPYAYQWGLVAAQNHLTELGAPLPALPPFDPGKFAPMPAVEIDPDDEFHAEE